MQLEIKNLKYTHKNKILILVFLILALGGKAQNVVVDSSQHIKNEEKQRVSDTVKTSKRVKVEGVSAVIGEYIVLDSDIDKSYVELQQQNISIEGVTRCELLGKLMEDKLYAHHAKIDSLVVSDVEITQRIEQQLDYIIGQFGGDEQKVVKFYKKASMAELRKELFEANKTIQLANAMQRKVIEDVEVTPEEVRTFFFAIPEDERPVFSAEVEVAQIVVTPEVTEQARQNVIEKLESYRRDVIDNGASFATKAVLYSKDGSAQKGGLIQGIKKNSPYAKEFKDRAFSLLEGEVSEPFETEFGYHILTVDKVRGQEIDVRHIILFPEISQEVIDKAEAKLDSIRTQIKDNKITFAEAARKFSDDTETKNNGGQLVNPISFDTRFDLTKMDPTQSAQIYNLKEGEVSKIYNDRDRTGKVKFKILTVTKKFEEHKSNFQKDYEKIKELALKQKQIREIEEWQKLKIKDTYVNVNNDYYNCDFSSNWIKK